jgi:hypothetical protein
MSPKGGEFKERYAKREEDSQDHKGREFKERYDKREEDSQEDLINDESTIDNIGSVKTYEITGKERMKLIFNPTTITAIVSTFIATIDPL